MLLDAEAKEGRVEEEASPLELRGVMVVAAATVVRVVAAVARYR
jgi:hypothetical protein